jgi:uncharacterized membrane protein
MLFIVIAAVFYAVAIVLGTVASRNMNSNLAAGIVNLLSGLIPIAVAIPLVIKKTTVSKLGFMYAILAGICIAIFSMALTKSYSMTKVGIVAPLVFGGAILLSTVLSYFFLKEKVTALQWVGLIFLTIGLSIVIYARATGK